MVPESVRPSQDSFTGRKRRAGTAVARRRTWPPSASRTETVTSSASLTEKEMALTSRRPSPLGEKNFVSRPTSTTGGALLRRWATKKAENVAPTSSTNTARASRFTGARCGYWALSRATTTTTLAPSPASAWVSGSIGRTSEMLSWRPMARAWVRAALV